MTIAAIAAALLYAITVWWGATGGILWLDRRPRASFGWSLAIATALAAIATAALVLGRTQATPAGAFVAFTAALTVWGWHELSFLTGLITGPRTVACPPDAYGLRRFRLAAATLIHHEVALAVTAALVGALTLDAPNPIGGWTFLILFTARLSAKLNLFLGAPAFSDELFPRHLRYLISYMRRGSISALFPASVLGLGATAGLLGWLGLDPKASAFQVVGCALLFTLTALALLEHVFMALPLPDAALWRWAMPKSERPLGRSASIVPTPLETTP